MTTTPPVKQKLFSRYEAFIIAVLTILQFTLVLDFMVISPLGDLLTKDLDIKPDRFSWVVSVYAYSAGIAGFLAAGFADKFDRKKLLLIFYTGFLLGTVLCAMAHDYHMLLVARIVTGLFGGVMGATTYAIVTDLFKMEVRGRVMGFLQMAFAASQVLGIPIGLVLSNRLGWHAAFWMIAGFGVVIGIIVLVYMKPVTAHLHYKTERNPFAHLLKTITQSDYLTGFLATTLLATGGFMLMPFGAVFGINNLGLTNEQLPILYGVSGVFSLVTGPLIGKMSDKLGKFNTFVIGSLVSMIMVAIYTRMGITPLWLVIAVSVIMFAGIMSRMVSSGALMTAIPAPQDRGAFMSINGSVQQLAGGLAASIAGHVVVQNTSGKLLHYDTLGNIVIGAMAFVIFMMYIIDRMVKRKLAAAPVQAQQGPPAATASPVEHK
jgi:predicted MFS family arabinose efflux permease